MAEKTRAELDAYFNTGDTPTEAQFQDLIDSISNFLDDIIFYDYEDGIVAFNGGGQANAYELTGKNSHVETSVNPGDSVKLKANTKAVSPFIVNTSGNAIDIYPPSGQQLNNLGANNSYSLANNQAISFYYVGSNRWFSVGAV